MAIKLQEKLKMFLHGNSWNFSYDNNGNILTQTVNGQTTSFVYDVMWWQIKVTAPGGVITNTAYYQTGEVRRIDGARYIDIYGEMQYAPNEDLNFDYGIKIGASSGLGAGVYVLVSGQIGISYIF